MSHPSNIQQRLQPGVQFTVAGQGRYRVVRLRDNGNEVNAWGPIQRDGSTPRGQMRTFTLDAITRFHRKVRGR